MNIEGNDTTVRDLMRSVLVVHETATLREALETLVGGRCNFASVVNTEGTLIGGISAVVIIRAILPDYLEEDAVASKFADISMLKEDVRRAGDLKVQDFVQRDIHTLMGESGILEATALASVDGHGRIIVVDEENKPIGIVTRTEIKRVLAYFLGIEDKDEETCSTNNCTPNAQE